MPDYFGQSPDGYQKPLYGANNFSDVIDKPAALVNLGAASADDVLKAANPIGTIIAFYGSVAPYGYLPCSGQIISNSTFPSLVSFLGGTTSATLPDMRGEFLRGWDNGRGIDVGRTVRSWQADAFASHSHVQTYYPTGGAAANRNLGDSVGNVSGAASTSNNSTLATGSSETRPRNISVLYCIKAYDAPVSATSINIAALAAEIAGRATAPQFDGGLSWATTAFVQRAIGSYSGFVTLTDTRPLIVSDIGKLMWVSAAGLTLTLPTPTSLGIPAGSSVTMFCTGNGVTVASGAGATLNNSAATVSSINIKVGQSATFIALGVNTWQLLNFSADLGNNSDFALNNTGNGYQKLPSGLIIQWGSAGPVTSGASSVIGFPMVFPTACINAVATVAGSGSNLSTNYSVATTYTASQLTLWCYMAAGGNSSFRYIAIGY